MGRYAEHSGSGWWWTVGLLIAVPALSLAALGLRSVRLDQLEWQQQNAERENQVARLADLELASVLHPIETTVVARNQGTSSRALRTGVGEGRPFALDVRGVTFLREQIHIADAAGTPDRGSRLSPGVKRAVADAQAAEAQGRHDEARQLLARIAGMEPALADWARWTTARSMHAEAATVGLRELADPAWSRSRGRSPGGLPVALVAAAFAGTLSHGDRATLRPLVHETHEALRAGTWLLSLDERRFYDAELARLMTDEPPTGNDALADPALEDLEGLAGLIRRTVPTRSASVRVAAQLKRRPVLLLWSAADGSSSDREGVVLDARDLVAVGDRALRPLTSNSLPGLALRDEDGLVVWSSASDTGASFSTRALRSVPGWELLVDRPTEPTTLGERRLLWFGLVSMLVIMLTSGLVMTVRTRRREAALARRQADFVAAVSHEFKSPLTSIRLHMERLASGRAAAAEATNYYAAVDAEAVRLERLVDRLLDSQQQQEGRTRYRFAEASIAEAARTAVARLGPQAETKGIRVALDVQHEETGGWFDRDAITDVVENLVENAIKYSDAGSIVSVATETDHESVRVHVEDQGMGIDARDLPRIFEKFFRGRRGDATDVRGTGLGLSLAKAIVDAHGGTIAVSSTAGTGSRFSVTLPNRAPRRSTKAI